MNKFHLHHLHGHSLPTNNGGDVKEALTLLTTPEKVRIFQSSLGLTHLRDTIIKRVIIVVGSGMNATSDGMSPASAARAQRAKEIYEPGDIVLFTARFSWRLLSFFSQQPEPHSTDARQMAQFLVSAGIPSKNIINEEWSTCTFGNAIFSRILLDSFLSPEVRLRIVTSSWALERAQIVFGLLFSDRLLEFEPVHGDIDMRHEEQRRQQEHLVNTHLYEPSIRHYELDKGDRVMKSLWYLREINASTPGTTKDWFALQATLAVQSAGIDSGASYGVKKN